MAVPLLTKKIFEKPVKKLKTPQCDRKICVKVQEWDEAGPYLSQICSDSESITWKMVRNQPTCNDSDAETRLCRTSSSRKCHSKKRRSKEEKLGKRPRTEKRS